jgi:hypothetical protein
VAAVRRSNPRGRSADPAGEPVETETPAYVLARGRRRLSSTASRSRRLSPTTLPPIHCVLTQWSGRQRYRVWAMSLKDKFDNMLRIESAKLETTDRLDAEFPQRQLQRFRPLRVLVEELGAVADGRFLRAEIDDDGATAAVGRLRGESSSFRTDMQWEMRPNYSVHFDATSVSYGFARSRDLEWQRPGARVSRPMMLRRRCWCSRPRSSSSTTSFEPSRRELPSICTGWRLCSRAVTRHPGRFPEPAKAISGDPRGRSADSLDPSEAETCVAQITQTPPSALGTLELRWKASIAP